MSVDVKICGLRDEAGVKAAVNSGARAVGFVFHRSSTRFIASDIAAKLSALVPSSIMRVGLFVDAGDDEIRAVLRDAPLDLLQLHGNETPQRMTVLRAMTGLPMMKALRIATAEDLKPITDFESVADRLLFDTRIGDEPTGGTGKSFDWNLMKTVTIKKPWMLAGGLKASNLTEAIRVTNAKMVDVSSGVEDASGHKDPAKIREFIMLARTLN